MAWLLKEALAGLDMPVRNANNGAPPHYRILYLELRQRTAYEPRTRAASAPRPAAAGGRGGRGARPPRCRSGSPAAEPSGPGAKLGPPDHIQPIPAHHWAQGANGGQIRGPWPL
jgi:hypothetical protein